MKLRWFLSVHDSVDKILSQATRDKALEINNMEPITIEASSIEESFKKFYKSKEFEEFAKIAKNFSWYYYDENDCLLAYGMPYYLENEL